MGRPPKPEEEKFTERVVSFFTRTQFRDLLDFETETKNRGHAQAVRTLVLDGLRRHQDKIRKRKAPR